MICSQLSKRGLFFGNIIIGYKKYFFSFASLGEGIYLKGTVNSPTGKFTADSYFENWGGATGGALV